MNKELHRGRKQRTGSDGGVEGMWKVVQTKLAGSERKHSEQIGISSHSLEHCFPWTMTGMMGIGMRYLLMHQAYLDLAPRCLFRAKRLISHA